MHSAWFSPCIVRFKFSSDLLAPHKGRSYFFSQLQLRCHGFVCVEKDKRSKRETKKCLSGRNLISKRLMSYAHEEDARKHHMNITYDNTIKWLHECVCGKSKICVIRLNGPTYNGKPKRGSKIAFSIVHAHILYVWPRKKKKK